MLDIIGIGINIVMLIILGFVLFLYLRSRKTYNETISTQSGFCPLITCPCDDPDSACLQYAYRGDKDNPSCNYEF